MPARLHSAISGILAGGIPGFGTVIFLLWHPTAYPCDVLFAFVDTNGWPARYMAHKLPSLHHFSLRCDVDVSIHSTDGFLSLVVFVFVAFCLCCLFCFWLLLCLLLGFLFALFFGLFHQWIIRITSR